MRSKLYLYQVEQSTSFYAFHHLDVLIASQLGIFEIAEQSLDIIPLPAKPP